MNGEEFSNIRTKLLMTQGILASKLGVARRTIQQWEAGDRRVPETMRRIMILAETNGSVLDLIEMAAKGFPAVHKKRYIAKIIQEFTPRKDDK